MSSTFGDQPGDVVTSSRGDVLEGVSLSLYPTRADAVAQTNLLGTVVTDLLGRWSYTDATLTVVWVRTLDGQVYAVEDPTVSAAGALAAAAASAASAALSASLVGAPADTAVAAIVGNPASATRVSLGSTYAHGRVNALRMRRKFSLPFDNAAALPAQLAGGATANPWTMVNGIITPPAAEADWRVALARDTVMSNGIARVTITNATTTGVGTRAAGIVLTRDGGPYRYLAFLLRSNNAGGALAYGVYSIENGAFVALQGYTLLTDLDTAFAAPPAMTLEAERKGTTLSFRINGRTLWTSTATAYQYAGQVGLVSDPSLLATFRDFTVSEYLDPPISPLLTKVHASGSSITVGVGSSGYGSGITNSPTAFKAEVGASLQANYTGNPITVSNGGINGQNTAGMLTNLAADLATYTPQVCLIEASVNDAHMTDGIAQTAAQTMANLRAMVALCRQAGVIPALWTCKPINVAQIGISLGANDFTLTSHTKIADMNNVARKIAADEGVILADVSHAFNADSSATYTADGLHPNDAGHTLIAATLYDSITGAVIH